ncbi:MAG: DUF4097 family beta strand repeat-containing protein [Bacillota bacterium]|nr:DUF4097 family beta strand repeat-containing protein [Bacillota bacterium]
MKKTGLIVLIVICLIVFFTTLTSGVLLTIRTIGWQDLLDQSRLQDRLQSMVERFDFLTDLPSQREQFDIDDTKTLDLTNIKIIEIAGVSESITVHATSGVGSATLKGSYRALSPIGWVVEANGDVLKIYSPYPRFGVLYSNLSMTVTIPQTFAGTVKVSSVSGAVSLPDAQQIDWNQLDVSTISGSIRVENAAFGAIKLSSISGAISLKQIMGTIDCKTTSGAIALDYDIYKTSTVRSVSGAVQITLPAQSSVNISYTTVSGRFKNQDLPITVVTQTSRKLEGKIGTGEQPLTVSTTSGSFTIKGR